MGYVECLMFGAVISATDPVTVLAMFQQLRVDPKLYHLIFGESMLNDAVAIVLYASLKGLTGRPITPHAVWRASAYFAGVFTGSIAIGVAMALATALLFKYSRLHRYPVLESCLFALLAFASYLLSNGLEMSGIVSLLFNGMVNKHYTRCNLSLQSRRTVKYMYVALLFHRPPCPAPKPSHHPVTG